MTVNVTSFSFAKGMPVIDCDIDAGKVYVLDCRVLPDPYCEAGLEDKTGLDAEVEKYFEAHEEQVSALLEPAIDLLDGAMKVDDVVNLYLGCVGGRHRSVYCVHRVAELVRKARKDIVVTEKHLNLKNKKSR